MNKKRFTCHLEYNLWKYAVIAVAAVVVWCTVFGALAKPRKNEQIVIEFFGVSIDSEMLKNTLTENKETVTHKALKQISVRQNTDSSDMFYQLIQARMITSDIMVFSEDLLTKDSEENIKVKAENYFKPLDLNICNEYFKGDNVEYYYVNDKAYGVYLDLDNYGAENTRSVAFFSPNSVNLGEMNTKGNKTDTSALDTVAFLLGRDR